MRDRLGQPRDYVARSSGRRDTPTRYERAAAVFQAALKLAVWALLAWLMIQLMLHTADRADAAVAGYSGPVCEMRTATTAYCPGDH